MPIMTTFGAGGVALITVLALLAAGCSREQQDWRSAEAADTSEATEASSSSIPTANSPSRPAPGSRSSRKSAGLDAGGENRHRGRLPGVPAEHPSGRWSEEARIRIEAFSLGSAPRLAPSHRHSRGRRLRGLGVRALQLATAMAPPTVHESAAPPALHGWPGRAY